MAAKKKTSKKKAKEIRTITCAVGEAQSVMRALQEVGRDRMPIMYALRLKDTADCVGKGIEESNERMRAVFSELKDSNVKQGTKKHKELNERLNEISMEEVVIEIHPDAVPVEALVERDVMITPAALEVLLEYEILER
jgi:hypothetical protein